MMQKIIIYGAKSLALGIYKSIRFLYPNHFCIGFMVSSLKGNPRMLAGLKVWELNELRGRLLTKEMDRLLVLIATPEDLHTEIVESLITNGFNHYTCIDSRKESDLMERYFTTGNKFQSIHSLKAGTIKGKLVIFQAKSHKDKKLHASRRLPDWITPLQAGADLTEKQLAGLRDNTGKNISAKNANYCELTALYWIWKNALGNKSDIPGMENVADSNFDYYGLFHYRRILDITEEDLFRFRENDIDVILPYPTIHEPDIKEHHARYISDSDWEALRKALEERQPEYAKAYEEIFSQEYFYNYNMLIAKKEVLADYCNWLFPILERIEELSMPIGCERADRYIGYLGENLMTLYFMYHQKELNIVHAGRIMLT